MNKSSPPEARFSINLIVNNKNELLLLKRSDKLGLGPGKWGFPAGHIQTSESPKQCAFRELNEEIGTNTSLELVRTLGPVRDSFYGGVYEVYLFQFHWFGGEIILNHEHTEFAWVAPEDYKTYDVMPGLDEDIALLNLWPIKYLDRNKLPGHLLPGYDG